MYDVIFNKLRIDLVDEGEADVFNVQMIDVKIFADYYNRSQCDLK